MKVYFLIQEKFLTRSYFQKYATGEYHRTTEYLENICYLVIFIKLKKMSFNKETKNTNFKF